MTTKPRIFSSPSRYVQGQNAIHELGTYLKQLGTNPLLLADDTVWGLIEDQLTDGFKQEDLPVNRVQFEGFATGFQADINWASVLTAVLENTGRRVREERGLPEPKKYVNKH